MGERGRGEGDRRLAPDRRAERPTHNSLPRRLRRASVPAETRLWRRLRNRGLAGWKFRRQHRIGRYIVDFANIECHVVVELDGDVHLGRERADGIRQRIRDVLLVTAEIELVPWGTLPRSDYKSKLVDWSSAAEA